MLLQSLIRVDFSDKTGEPLKAKTSAAADIAFWQTWLQHSVVGSIFSQEASKDDVFKLLSISLTSITGQDDSVRLEGSTEQISRSFTLAPWLSRICSTSERQCLAWVTLSARLCDWLLACPTRTTRLASNWGQHTTLARNGASEDQQSVAVVLKILSAAEKLNAQCPEKL